VRPIRPRVYGIVLSLVGLGALALPPARAEVVPVADDPGPQVVIAHVDTGINPYAKVFRDDSPRAQQYPGTYIPGYPAGAEALHLHLDAPDWATAFALDKPIWDGLLADWNHDQVAFRARVFWVPGTKIVALRRQAAGTTFCPPADRVSPAPNLVNQCTDYPLLDDHGHGTMTANRMGGNEGSLCPECRVVSVEGLGAPSVQWIAQQGWIDVQTNSWASIPPQVADRPGQLLGGHSPIIDAARSMLVYFATGNGLAGAAGFAPCPTEEQSTLVRDAVWVGAHDNGHVAAWSCAPAHVVADGYGGPVAGNHTIDGFGPSPFACCTSAASPYAASEGAAIVLRARQLLNDHPSTGIHDGVVAHGDAAGAGITSGPLADGVFTLDELRDLVKHTAEARPAAGRDDGAMQWVGDPRVPDPTTEILPYGPGANAFCNGCVTAPVSWTDVPADVPAYVSIGYGAENERTLALADDVLRGVATLPSRADVDAFFATEGTVRDLVRGSEPS